MGDVSLLLPFFFLLLLRLIIKVETILFFLSQIGLYINSYGLSFFSSIGDGKDSSLGFGACFMISGVEFLILE